MELKQALEAATADLDVRPGFVGDVMTGARRRHTRKLLAVTAAVALLAGVTTGVVLTRSSSDDRLMAIDARMVAPTGGDLASSQKDIYRALALWRNAQNTPRFGENVTDFSMPSHVYWIGGTDKGPAALVVQPVRVGGSSDLKPLVGLVAMNEVVDREVVDRPGQERGHYHFGTSGGTHVLLTLGKKLFMSQNPVRDQNGKLTRQWQPLQPDSSGVAVVTAPAESKPVFVRSDTRPEPRDFTRQPLRSKSDLGLGRAFVPHAGLGWAGLHCKSDTPPPNLHSPAQAVVDLQQQAYLDYLVSNDAIGSWNVCLWTPDGRYAVVLEAYGQLYGALYKADGTFSTAVIGGPAVKDTAAPVRLVLPDGQGTIVADFNALIGPEQRESVWLAPAGTKEVTITRNGSSTVVPLP